MLNTAQEGVLTSAASLGGVLGDVSRSDEGVLGRSGRLGRGDRAGGDGSSPLEVVKSSLVEAVSEVGLLDDIVGHKLVAIDCQSANDLAFVPTTSTWSSHSCVK